MSVPLAEPTTRVPTRWVAAFSVATVGVFVGWYGPLQVLLARQAEQYALGDKENILAIVAGIGAAVSLVCNALYGAMSDRTTSRFGMRIPWIVGGTLLGVGGLGALSTADTLGGMILGWCLVQAGLNAPLAALSAAVPDQVPAAKRGTAGAWFGAAQIVGVIAGTGLAVAGLAAAGIVGGYLACAVFVLLSVLPYVLLRRDVVLTVRPAWDLRAFLRGFWLSPRRHPDFAWAWLTRFLINLGNAIALLYLLFYLDDAVHLADPEGGVLVLTAINAATLLVTVAVGGIWSDRVGRRRVFVSAAGLIMAVASVLLAFWPTWTGAVVAAAVLGLGFGAYTSVDFALITEVLPSAADRGKDLGVINVANTLPQVLAPAVAAPIVGHLGGYPVLYLVSAAVGTLGALLVYRIKSVA